MLDPGRYCRANRNARGLWRRVVDTKRIDPSFIVDRVPVYEPAKLTEAATLLRASSATDGAELLRVVSSTNDDDSTLVRPAATKGEALELTSLVGVPPIVLPDEAQEQGRR
jgi:hypothetical protein